MKKQFGILIENSDTVKQITKKKIFRHIGKLFRSRVHQRVTKLK